MVIEWLWTEEIAEFHWLPLVIGIDLTLALIGAVIEWLLILTHRGADIEWLLTNGINAFVIPLVNTIDALMVHVG